MITQKPDWLKVKLPTGDTYNNLRDHVKDLKLHTVCQEARCPNIAECWGRGTATIMILGDTCTRGCRFCAVKTGNPKKMVDWDEPRRVAEACVELNWKYVVLTSVDRDDLHDGGAAIFAETVRQIHQRLPETKVECLTGDFRGNLDQVKIVLNSGMDVFAHNLETCRRLTPSVRDRRASFDQTLKVLKYAKETGLAHFVKTSLMLGLGETEDEIEQTMDEAKAIGVDIFTMGQYLQPTKKHLPVIEFVPPEKFQRLKKLGLSKGFKQVVAGPLVRSSYHAEEAFQKT